MKTIEFNDYEINLIHGLLVDEEIRLKEKIPILLIESGYNFDNTKAYVEEVKRLRRLFTKIDDTEDYFEVADRIELAETPPEEREKEKRYIVPLPHLITSDGEQQYLTNKDDTWFASRRSEVLRQTWKEKHLKYIPEEYRKYAVEVE